MKSVCLTWIRLLSQWWISHKLIRSTTTTLVSGKLKAWWPFSIYKWTKFVSKTRIHRQKVSSFRSFRYAYLFSYFPKIDFSKNSIVPSHTHTHTYMQYNIINHLESTNFRREKKNSEGTRWGWISVFCNIKIKIQEDKEEVKQPILIKKTEFWNYRSIIFTYEV